MSAQSRRLWMLIPLVLFLAVAGLFFYALSGNPNLVPSVLIGKPVPETKFPALPEFKVQGQSIAGFASTDLASSGATLVNFWASWCAPCIAEHPQLIALSKLPGVRLFGVNYKDEPADARQFLGRYGNPFTVIGVDPKGRNAIEWGVYGMPETFLINAKGEIVYKHVGPITPEHLRTKVVPVIQTLLEQQKREKLSD